MASRRDEQHDQLLKELNEERLASLMRISRTLESLIEQLRERSARIPSLPVAIRDRELAAYRDLRKQARTYRWYLEVQREALGIRQHRMLDEVYPIPGDLDAGS
jgi:hypothetical protein